MNEQKQKILEFLKRQKLMVISSINKHSLPESAVVGFSQTNELEIIFGTFNDARKYANLQKNKNVSLVVGWDLNDKITIQYEGIAHELSGNELKEGKKIHSKKLPEAMEFINHEKERFFKISPKWIRYSNLNKGGEIFEVTWK